MTTEVLEREFDVPGLARLVLNNVRGSVLLQGRGTPGKVKVTAVKYTDSGDDEQTQINIHQNDDGQVLVETHFQNGGLISAFTGRGQPCRIDYTVHLPTECEVRARSVSAKIEAEHLEGMIELETVSGSLTATTLAGKLHAKTVSGEIRGSGCAGELRSKSISGRIEWRECRFDSVDADTISGNIHFYTPLLAGPYRFDTKSGSVKLYFPPGTGFNLDFHSISGRMVAEQPIPLKIQRGNFASQVGGGGPLVYVRTISGNLHLISSEGADVRETAPVQEEMVEEPPVPPVSKPVAADETPVDVAPLPPTDDVLDRLANGEISFEEALKALKSR